MTHEFIIIMVETSHPGNLGAAARAMKNMGIKKLRLVRCVNHQDSEAYSRSSGAEDVLYQATCHNTLKDAIQDCHHVIATSGRRRTQKNPPTYCATRLPSLLKNTSNQQKIALVFGNEQNGLDNDSIQLAHWQISVPTNPEFKSLNVASCVQLICFLCKGNRLEMPSNESDSTVKQPTIDQLDSLINTVSAHAFQKGHDKAQHDVHKLRQLLFRMNPNSDEVNFLHGIIRRLIKSTIQ